mmetsp:Transcript_113603/g.367485  ORF Transcript_113603/g.367485 Transcript_113603/m.367485 type:complete len:204 (+) Transcript_113603:152-763(+)
MNVPARNTGPDFAVSPAGRPSAMASPACVGGVAQNFVRPRIARAVLHAYSRCWMARPSRVPCSNSGIPFGRTWKPCGPLCAGRSPSCRGCSAVGSRATTSGHKGSSSVGPFTRTKWSSRSSSRSVRRRIACWRPCERVTLSSWSSASAETRRRRSCGACRLSAAVRMPRSALCTPGCSPRRGAATRRSFGVASGPCENSRASA